MNDIEDFNHKKEKPCISAYIITKNEEKRIARALESVRWVDELIVLDSGSTDKTVEIAKKFGAKVATEAFKDFVNQKNKAMELCNGEWLLNIDADEEVSEELRKSIEKIIYGNKTSEVPLLYNIRRKSKYLGKWIMHCGWYPEYRTRLSKRGHASWKGKVLHERLEGDGPIGTIPADILHRPYLNLSEHLKTIDNYSGLWADREVSSGRATNYFEILIRPFAKFFKMYFLKAGFLDKGPGLIASIMGAWYTFMKYARLHELKEKNK